MIFIEPLATERTIQCRSVKQKAASRFVTAPIVVERENAYVLFVTDVTLGGTAQSFEVHCLHEPLLDHYLSDFHSES